MKGKNRLKEKKKISLNLISCGNVQANSSCFFFFALNKSENEIYSMINQISMNDIGIAIA